MPATKRKRTANQVVANVARKQAVAYGMAMMGATAATGYKRRPRGMAGSGLPFARHDGLENRPFSTEFSTNEQFALRKGVRVGPHTFSNANLRQMLAVNPYARNPLTRAPLPTRVLQKYRPPAFALTKSMLEFFTRHPDMLKMIVGKVLKKMMEAQASYNSTVVWTSTFSLKIETNVFPDKYTVDFGAYPGNAKVAPVANGVPPLVNMSFDLFPSTAPHVVYTQAGSWPEWLETSSLVHMFNNAIFDDENW